MRNLTPAELQAKLPKLSPDNHKHTSPADPRYNCVAFANENKRKWWEAGCHGGKFFWPEKIADDINGWVKMFTDQGYELTENRDVEPGFEKVAIFVDLSDMLPSHVAKSDGRAWKSKLGRYQDIEHSSLDLLEGDQSCEYGIVDKILKRRIESTS